MAISFATCNRNTALGYLQKVCPSSDITDTEDSAGPLLDFVEKDLVRIQDPMMHGSKIGVIAGDKWSEDEDVRKEIVAACEIFYND